MVFGQRPSVDPVLKDDDDDYYFDEYEPTAASGSDSSLNDDAIEAIRDSLGDADLELMFDVVMRIREDPIYASTIYVDCPRLQYKLDQRPDLRPVFEDPELVRMNFEQVYRKAGGVLPEDEEDEQKKACWKKCLATVVKHPLFKVLRFLLLIKKLVGCVTGGGFAMAKGCFQQMCCEAICEGAAEGVTDVDFDVEGGEDGGDGMNAPPNPHNAASRAALNQLADNMEDPEVAEAMQELLENDPEGLEEAIENDPELKALRDSNPLCAELMSDPETMKILVDPDNLRALGECPDLIEADFADPDWEPPDVESGGDDLNAGAVKDGYYAANGIMELAEQAGDADIYDADLDIDADADDVEGEGEPEEEGEEEEEEEEENALEEYELGDTEGPEAGDNDMGKSGGKGGGKGGKGKQQNNNGQNRGGGFLAQVGAGITDMVAGELVGASMGDILPGGDDFPMDDMEDIDVDEIPGEDELDKAADDADEYADAAADAADAAEGAALAMENANAFADATDLLMNDDVCDQLDGLEDGMDHVEDTHDDAQDNANKDKTAAAAAGAGAAACALAPIGVGGGSGKEEGEGGEGSEEEEEPKKSRFGFIGGFASAVSTAAKEAVAGAILGDDLGELLVEKQEEEDEDEEDGEDDKKEKEEPRKKKGMFRRNR